MNTTMKARIHTTWRFSSMPFTTLSLSRSSVRVEDELITRPARVDIDAESTSTITTPMSTSGRVESIEGMMESYTGVPFAWYSMVSP